MHSFVFPSSLQWLIVIIIITIIIIVVVVVINVDNKSVFSLAKNKFHKPFMQGSERYCDVNYYRDTLQFLHGIKKDVTVQIPKVH
jgi:uncharacterized protein YpmB